MCDSYFWGVSVTQHDEFHECQSILSLWGEGRPIGHPHSVGVSAGSRSMVFGPTFRSYPGPPVVCHGVDVDVRESGVQWRPMCGRDSCTCVLFFHGVSR